jgi:hypothetical protein
MRSLYALPILAAAVIFTGCEATVVDDGHYGYHSGHRYYYDDRPGYYYHNRPSYYSRASYYNSGPYYRSHSYPRYGYSNYGGTRSYHRSDANYSRNTVVNRTVVNRTNVNRTNVNRTNVNRTNVVKYQAPATKKQKAKDKRTAMRVES